MRLPPLLPNIVCRSVRQISMSWVLEKWHQPDHRTAYIGTGEYEIFEFGLGKGNSNLRRNGRLDLLPRPFLVERGHFDGARTDDRVAKEFVKFAFSIKGGGPPKIENGKGNSKSNSSHGPHTIQRKRTFRFF